ncbi:MAG: ComF family protein [Patescibacteria group bacterium]|nr:ComF family protein [Patescibacteria group bacterium]
MLKKLRTIRAFILDLLFPITCFQCNKPGYYLCPQCVQKIERYPNNNCPFCNVFSNAGKTCKQCQNNYTLDQLLVFTYYSNPLIKKVVHSFKYSSVYLLARDSAQLLAQLIQENLLPEEFSKSLIVPVPMHPKKQKRRGFNQTQLLGESLSLITKIPLADNLLKKTKNTVPQMQVKNKDKRRANIEKAFSVNQKKLSAKNLSKKIILIDDVTTTGATLSHCAETLKQAGFQKVIGIVIARQPKTIL